jgi:uncharacterized protein (TIGR02246 family)
MTRQFEETKNNKAEVQELIENWVEAVRKRDLQNILAYHSDDIVMFDVPQPFKSIGMDAYRKTWDTFFKYTKAGVFDIQEMNVVADNAVAFCFATMKCEDKSSGNDYQELNFRLTIGLKKINNQWIIFHEHHSIPST